MKKKSLFTLLLISSFSYVHAQWTNGTNINNTNSGNVGIGITDPAFKLDVHGHIRGRSFLRLTNTGPGNGLFADDSHGSTIFSILRQANNEVRFQGFGFLSFYTNGSNGVERMRIQGNGNVGIGTTDPGSYRLNVWGRVRAHEIIVNTSGADFVFEEDYILPSLTEVETFIIKNKHLPEILSASEMQENGMNVGELQIKLLQKIEELTLYIIELNKEVEVLKMKKGD